MATPQYIIAILKDQQKKEQEKKGKWPDLSRRKALPRRAISPLLTTTYDKSL